MQHPGFPTQARAASSINAVLGAWLMLSPWLLGPSSLTVRWADVITGFFIGILGTMRSIWPQEAIVFSWANLYLGGWTALLPWTLRFIDDPPNAWNSVIVGLAVVLFGGCSILATMFHRAQRPF